MRKDVIVYLILGALIVGWFFYYQVKRNRVITDLDKEFVKVQLATLLNGRITEIKHLDMSLFRVDSNFCRCEIDGSLKIRIGVNEIGNSPRFLRVASLGATLLKSKNSDTVIVVPNNQNTLRYYYLLRKEYKSD